MARFPLPQRMTDAYRLYLGFELAMSLLLGLVQATTIVYWVEVGHLNPLQLVLLGTVLEAAYFVFQLPTGLLADLVSRRLCVITGVFAVALGYVTQGLSAKYPVLLAAQLFIALGAALMYGAQESWIADELAQDAMTHVYVRAEQFGLIGVIVGSAGSGVLASISLRLPLLVGGASMCGLALVLGLLMPERNFTPTATGDGVRAVVKAGVGLAVQQTRSTSRVVRAVPGLVLVFGMTFFLGMWSESFDRLWGDFLLKDIAFPQVFDVRPVVWFSALACVVSLLALGTTEFAGRRTKRLGPSSVTDTLLGLTGLTVAAVVVLGTAHGFVVAAVAYLVVAAVRPAYEPLVTGWMVVRVESGVRATALSARDMFDSGGQIVGGPVIGAIGNLASIRAALLAGAIALGPAMGLLALAGRRVRAVFDTVDAADEAPAAPVAPPGQPDWPSHSSHDTQGLP
jgi:DHA3 family tetracycline resistance protein-like MFS transporter